MDATALGGYVHGGSCGEGLVGGGRRRAIA